MAYIHRLKHRCWTQTSTGSLILLLLVATYWLRCHWTDKQQQKWRNHYNIVFNDKLNLILRFFFPPTNTYTQKRSEIQMKTRKKATFTHHTSLPSCFRNSILLQKHHGIQNTTVLIFSWRKKKRKIKKRQKTEAIQVKMRQQFPYAISECTVLLFFSEVV